MRSADPQLTLGTGFGCVFLLLRWLLLLHTQMASPSLEVYLLDIDTGACARGVGSTWPRPRTHTFAHSSMPKYFISTQETSNDLQLEPLVTLRLHPHPKAIMLV